ncbi:hypothetical protein KDD17_16560 [Sulfitobacter albidus]|uniref:LPS-assembly lipoprotein n=1 Tax=Sulfitobacter albidus TaxID=2829501 RepID=A0A975JDH4_9RHOB|nr:LPS assembly lipoprotein LptE [Sulfitobacter albidus]QUJ76464.1 hypothetical protein KDD17_16560 [Sulfitobacter albidus]
MSLLERRRNTPSFNRRALLLGALGLGACGFTPVYGPDGAGTALRGRVEVQAPTTESGYLMTRQLEQRLGRAATPRFALDMGLSTSSEGLAVNTEGDIERFNLIGAAAYSLRDLETGAVVTSGEVNQFTAYSATGTTVATLAAERDALERLMVILADQIVARLFTSDIPA